MKHIDYIKKIIHVYFYDETYNEGLKLLIQDLENEELNVLKYYIMKILQEWFSTNEALISYLIGMGVQSPHEIRYFNNNKHNAVYLSFFEKLYYDLFHEDPEFQPELLKIIDPETGDLREEFKQDKKKDAK